MEVLQCRENYHKGLLRQKPNYQTPRKSKKNKNEFLSGQNKVIGDVMIKEDPDKWLRKISKYELDRGTLDLNKFVKERNAERTSKNLKKKEIVAVETEKQKQREM